MKELQKKDPMREFYRDLVEIKDLYENQGYRKMKTLYNYLSFKNKWSMEYSTFTRHFNKEIKNKITAKINPSKNTDTILEVEPIAKKEEKEVIKDGDTDTRPTMTPEREAELRKRLNEDIGAVGLERSEALKKQLQNKE